MNQQAPTSSSARHGSGLLSLILVFWGFVAGSVALAQAPGVDSDLRLVVDKGLLVTPTSQLQHYKLGKWIRLGEAPWWCGDRTQFDIIVKDPPLLRIAPWSDADHLPGTSLSLDVSARAQIHGCLGDQAVDATAWAATNTSSLGSGTIGMNGQAGFTFVGIPFRFPFSTTLQVPAELTHIPIALTDTADASFEFGSGDLGSWTPSPEPKRKVVPLSLRVSSFDRFLSVDASVESEKRPTFSTAAAAQQYWESDVPTWDAKNVGFTIRESLFGDLSASGAGRGLIKALLPIRARLTLRGRVLGLFPVERTADVLLNGGSVKYVTHEKEPAVEVLLRSTEVKMGDSHIVGGGSFLSNVTGRILFDRLRIEGNKLRFRVADFRIKVGTKLCLGIPVTLSSGELENSLNGGSLDLGGIATQALALPKCLDAHEKFISTPGACGEPIPVNGLIGKLGHLSGNRVVKFTFDPSTLALRFKDGSVDGKSWKGIQAAGNIAASVSPD